MECKLKICKNKTRARGYCQTHYHHRIFLKKHPLWDTYQNMLRRCYQPKHLRYKDWGGRGIKVCDRWRESYANFAEDIGARPTPFHQLDRKNNNGNYTPKNCQWALPTTNSGAGRRRKKSNNTSGVVGVCYNIRMKKWQANITIDKHRHHLGWFINKIDAIETRKLAEIYYANPRPL